MAHRSLTAGRWGSVPRPVAWLSAVLLVYLAVPLAVFLARSARHPGEGFGVPGLFGAFATSAEAATISACLVGFFGVPLAYWLARSHSRLAAVAGTVVQLPLALPPLMSGVVLLYVVGPNTLLGRLANGRLTESLAGIVLAQSFVSSPFLVIAARSAFERVPIQLEDVAATAGWGPLGRFAHVALPLASPGVRAGLLLCWLRAFGEYGATVMLAYYPFSLPVFTYVQFSAVGLPAAQAPSLLSLGLAVVVVGVSRLRPPRRRPKLPSPLGPPPIGARPAETVAFNLATAAGTFRLQLGYTARTPRLAIVGPSGAGKSMTLRCLAGLLPGEVCFGPHPVGDLATEARQVGYVPQGDSLMPHLRVWDNVTFGPHAWADDASRWLTALGMGALADRWPGQLSGGQRQRVALARALSCRPRVLLLDEPFTGLDAPQRASLVRELRQLQHEANLSTVLVTHDINEAALLADEVVVISGGRAAQSGPMTEVLEHPASPEVAAVLGVRNLRPGVAASGSSLRAGPAGQGPAVVTAPHGLAPGQPLTWAVSPRVVDISAAPGSGAGPATVLDVAPMGAFSLCLVSLGGQLQLEAEVTGATWAPGDECWARFAPEAVMVWPVDAHPAPTGPAQG